MGPSGKRKAKNMLFDFSTVMDGALGHDPERMRKQRNYRKHLEWLGVSERRYHARLLEFQKLGDKLQNALDENDEGVRMIRAAAKRHPVITADDFYRILQLQAVFEHKSSMVAEPGKGDNWAWRTPMDEYATDMFMLMLTRSAIMWMPDCVGLDRVGSAFMSRHKKKLTQAIKFRRKLLGG